MRGASLLVSGTGIQAAGRLVTITALPEGDSIVAQVGRWRGGGEGRREGCVGRRDDAVLCILPGRELFPFSMSLSIASKRTVKSLLLLTAPFVDP